MRVFDREKLERMEKYIHDYMQRSNGTVPKLSEIMEYMDMSKATAYRYIMKLNDEGKVEYNGKGTMKLIDDRDSVRGDSMVDIGVNEGDLVLVKKTVTALDGQVVVALTENGNTLKRLSYENGKPILLAENSAYSEKERIIRPKRLEIQGIALKIIKDIK